VDAILRFAQDDVLPMTLIALTRSVPPSIAHCELTHLAREPIDLARAIAQHDAYERALESLGYHVQRLQETPELPDSVFVEDTAVIVDELAVITRPGAESRRAETASVAEALRAYRELRFIEAPGTLDGGDVLRIGKRIFIGRTARTNAEGIEQLQQHLPSYEVIPVEVHGALHLKTAVTAVSDDAVIVNPDWADFDFGYERIAVAEPFAANVLRTDRGVLMPSAFPLTAARLRARGIVVHTVDADELAKAEGGVTCCSLLLSSRDTSAAVQADGAGREDRRTAR
jgi:dimethylargininase